MKTFLLLGAAATALTLAPAARADDDSGFLSGSTEALVFGPTGDFTVYPGYTETADSLYLQPLGFDGTATSITLPDNFDYGPSVTEGEQQLLSTVETDWTAGDFSTSDPLTLFGYSQSSSVISGDEQAFADYGIPEDALRIVLVGDTSNPLTGYLEALSANPVDAAFLEDIGWGNLVGLTTPDSLYPTDIYTIVGDEYGDYLNAAWDGSDIHLAYMGLTEAQIQVATEMTEGLTNYFTIDTPSNLLATLLDAASNVFG